MLVGLAVGVDVSVGVMVNVNVGGICVLVGKTVMVNVSVLVIVGSMGVSEAQAEINEMVTNNITNSQKS